MLFAPARTLPSFHHSPRVCKGTSGGVLCKYLPFRRLFFPCLRALFPIPFMLLLSFCNSFPTFSTHLSYLLSLLPFYVTSLPAKRSRNLRFGIGCLAACCCCCVFRVSSLSVLPIQCTKKKKQSRLHISLPRARSHTCVNGTEQSGGKIILQIPGNYLTRCRSGLRTKRGCHGELARKCNINFLSLL